MSLTFETLINHNKNTSFAIVAGMIAFLALLCGLVMVVLSQAPAETAPDVFLLGGALGGGAATLASLVCYFGGRGIVGLINDAHRIEKPEDPVLFNVVEEMAIAGGVPAPEVYVIFDESPNAFASGRDPAHAMIGITSGLRKKLSRDELQAVIAHEMSHIKNYDILLMMMVGVFAGLIVLVSDFFLRSFQGSLRMSGGRTSGDGKVFARKGGLLFIAIAIVVAVLLSWLAPLIARLLQLAVSREREYLADATAVQLCRNPLALASALKKIAMDPEELHVKNRATEHMFIVNPDPRLRLANPDLDSVWSTHPPLIKRIVRLQQLADKYYSVP